MVCLWKAKELLNGDLGQYKIESALTFAEIFSVLLSFVGIASVIILSKSVKKIKT